MRLLLLSVVLVIGSVFAEDRPLIAADIGELTQYSNPEYPKFKYILVNQGRILCYVIEPSDVSLGSLIGKMIYLDGYDLHKRYSKPVLQMRLATSIWSYG